MTTAEPALLDLPALVERAAGLADRGRRVLLGVSGAPGAGKSTLAARVVRALGERAVLVPMDGFHLHDDELRRLGRLVRKGAPDTFDAAGYVALLRRLKAADDDVVYAPVFDRARELSLAGALPVPREVPLVVTEGNYLLAEGAFAPVRDLLDESWYLDLDPGMRRQRLVARHVKHGRTPEQAREWALGTDERNAELIARTSARASLVVRLAPRVSP